MTQAVAVFTLQTLAGVVGLSLAGGFVAGVTAALYRWYARSALPLALPTLLSVGVVAGYLNTTGSLQSVLGGRPGVLALPVVAVNTATFVGAALAAAPGARAGDRFAESVTAVSGARSVDAEVSRLVRSVGRVVTVELPEDVDDIDGYDPVAPETKADVAGTTLVFPRGLTVAELRERLVARLREDFGVGHVDLELTADATVEHLGVGSRAAGLGPTLPPGTVAVAVHADPALSASPGDRVQVYRPGQPPERVATGELRAVAGDVVTLAVDATDAAALDDATRYRLATLPATPRDDTEFARLLRGADETMAVVTVAPDAPLVGASVDALAVTVVAARAANGPVEVLPGRERVLAPGDDVYAIGRPEALRKLESAARPGDGAASD